MSKKLFEETKKFLNEEFGAGAHIPHDPEIVTEEIKAYFRETAPQYEELGQ